MPESEEGKRRHDFLLSEHKIFAGVIGDLDKLIAQLYGGTVAVTIAFFGPLVAYVFGGRPITPYMAYLFLLPTFLLVPSFTYLLSLRRDLVGVAAYVRALEDRLGVPGFQTGLEMLRRKRGGESNDPIPHTFWGINAVYSALFIYVLYIANGPWQNAFAIVPVATIMARLHVKWKHLISRELPPLVRAWRDWARDKDGAHYGS